MSAWLLFSDLDVIVLVWSATLVVAFGAGMLVGWWVTLEQGDE